MKKKTDTQDPKTLLKSQLDTAVEGLKTLAAGLLTTTTLAGDLMKIRQTRVCIDRLNKRLSEA